MSSLNLYIVHNLKRKNFVATSRIKYFRTCILYICRGKVYGIMIHKHFKDINIRYVIFSFNSFTLVRAYAPNNQRVFNLHPCSLDMNNLQIHPRVKAQEI
uniref:Uncharacterized protein n=1 Tax=Opuntia streptacantha TaxID=393608 RepID=A0A7C8YLP6_OPUST